MCGIEENGTAKLAHRDMCVFQRFPPDPNDTAFRSSAKSVTTRSGKSFPIDIFMRRRIAQPTAEIAADTSCVIVTTFISKACILYF